MNHNAPSGLSKTLAEHDNLYVSSGDSNCVNTSPALDRLRPSSFSRDHFFDAATERRKPENPECQSRAGKPELASSGCVRLRPVSARPFSREIKLSRALVARIGPMAQSLRASSAQELGRQDKPNDMGPVTNADLRANEMLVNAIAQAFPNDAIVAEESDNTKVDRGATRCWYLDPIDGTSDFAAGRSCWAIHIGLCVDGRPVFGLVHEPDLGRSTFGVIDPVTREKRLWCECWGAVQPISSEPGQTKLPPRAVVSMNHRNARVDAALARLQIPASLTRGIGSTGVKGAIVARGEAELYVHPSQKTRLWDSCAPQAILEAGGGHMTGIDGSPIDYRNGPMHHPAGLLATRGMDHTKVVEKLWPMTQAWIAG